LTLMPDGMIYTTIPGPLHISQSKDPGPEDQALVIPRGDLIYWNFIGLLKFQISNHK